MFCPLIGEYDSLLLKKKEDMFITTVQEINAYLPTSVYSNNDGLLALMEDTEDTYILPVLGNKLFNRMVDYYQKKCEESDEGIIGIVNQKDVDPEVKLLKLIQKSVIYLTLANHSGLLSVSLNDGGGFNTVSTEGYDSANKDSVTRFERDAFFEGKRGIDRILIFLETDAKSDTPKFVDDWKESRYYYEIGDSLFATADCYNRYCDISGSREKFVALSPTIRKAQSAYIAPVLGDELMEAMIKYQVDNSIPVTTEETKEATLKVWDKALDKLRLALAVRTETISKGTAKGDVEAQADLFLYQAKEYIVKNQDYFMPYIETSSLYVAPAEETDTENLPDFDGQNNEDAIFVFMPHLNRH